MISLRKVVKFSNENLNSERGFTLIEVIVALAITSILLIGVYSAYSIQQRSFKTQTMIVNVQQNLRGALGVMEDEIRMAGYDAKTPETGFFGITDITIDGNGNGTITFTGDFGSGTDNNGTLDGNETFSYSIYDSGSTVAVGNFDLGREVGGGGRQLLAEGIEALGFAFAFDADEDNQLDTAGGNVLWGYDSNGDNVLDADVAGGGLPGGILVDMGRIRVVRIWLLARTRGNVSNRDTDTYFIGTRTVPAFNDYHRRILIESTVTCRNM